MTASFNNRLRGAKAHGATTSGVNGPWISYVTMGPARRAWAFVYLLKIIVKLGLIDLRDVGVLSRPYDRSNINNVAPQTVGNSCFWQ